MDLKGHIKNLFDVILYFIILPFSAVSFVVTPLTNDSRIFLAAASIADAYYPLPYGFDAAYEVKPVMNRILNWVLYKVANAFVPFEDNFYSQFGIVVKITALVILVLCCWYISRKIVFPYGFPFLFLAFVCQANFGILMSEWFSVLFSLVAISLCMDGSRSHTFLAGVLMVCVGLLKSITSLMLIPVICAVWLIRKKIDLPAMISGCVVASLAFLVMCLTFWPYSIGDMLMSRLIAHVGMYDLTTVFSWFWITQSGLGFPVAMLTYSPIIIVGAVAAGIVSIKFIARSDWKSLALFFLMWLVPTAIVLTQSEFIVYHYLVLMLPSIVSVAMLTKPELFIPVAMAGIFIGFLLINCMFGSFTVYEYTFWNQKEMNADSLNSQFDLIGQSSILYLDPGDAPYYFHANSSCHYITPMPVERSTPKWDLSYLPQYKETYSCIMDYEGKYIVSDLKDKRQYFGEGILKNESIMQKISSEYDEVGSESWTIYKRKES